MYLKHVIKHGTIQSSTFTQVDLLKIQLNGRIDCCPVLETAFGQPNFNIKFMLWVRGVNSIN
jgi:hypothetical protein